MCICDVKTVSGLCTMARQTSEVLVVELQVVLVTPLPVRGWRGVVAGKTTPSEASGPRRSERSGRPCAMCRTLIYVLGFADCEDVCECDVLQAAGLVPADPRTEGLRSEVAAIQKRMAVLSQQGG